MRKRKSPQTSWIDLWVRLGQIFLHLLGAFYLTSLGFFISAKGRLPQGPSEILGVFTVMKRIFVSPSPRPAPSLSLPTLEEEEGEEDLLAQLLQEGKKFQKKGKELLRKGRKLRHQGMIQQARNFFQKSLECYQKAKNLAFDSHLLEEINETIQRLQQSLLDCEKMLNF